MIRRTLLGLIKFFMMTTPFLSMMLMLLALWGVVGKATYTELQAAQQNAALEGREARNYLVNETKTIEQCPNEGRNPAIGTVEENPMPKKIDWEHVV